MIANTVIKGKWVRRELKKAKQIFPNIEIKRNIFTLREEWLFNIKKNIFNLFFFLTPYKMQNIILQMLRRR
jgi:hypothetical protein